MTDTANRILLLIVGAALLALSVWGLLTAYDALPSWLPAMAPPSDWYRNVADAVRDRPEIWAWVVAVGVLVLVVAAARWLVQQVLPNPRPRVSTTTLVRGDRGRTTVEPVALARSMARDLGDRPGILRADARIASLGTVVRVELEAVLAEGTSRRQADDAVASVLERLSRAVDRDDVRADVRLRYTDRPGARVR